MKKRGLSTVIVSIILVALVLVAIGVVWVVVRNLIQEGIKGIGLERFTIRLDIENAYESNGEIIVNVQRKSGAGKLVGIKFILANETKSEAMRQDTNLSELEGENFNIVSSELNSKDVVTVSVAPVFESSGEEITGDITDVYILKSVSDGTGDGDEGNGDGEGDGGNGGDGGVSDCTPACSSEKPYCVVGECVECRSSLDCDAGELCTNGICVSEDCVPESYETTCGTWTCGTKLNNCGAIINCGADCPQGKMCEEGTCVSVISVNTGIVEEVWPPDAKMYFGSSTLPIDVSYQGFYVNFPEPSLEVDCLLIARYIFPIPGYDKSHIGFNFESAIGVGDTYYVWETLEECQAS